MRATLRNYLLAMEECLAASVLVRRRARLLKKKWNMN
jgi:hypothetical protein